MDITPVEGAESSAPVEQVETKETVVNPFKDYKERIKINGKEREVTLEELRREASKQMAADEKFKSAKQLNDEARQLKAAFESGNVVDALAKQGKTAKEIRTILEDHLLDIIDQENMDPKEKELKDLKKFKEQKDKEAAEEMSKKEAAKHAQEIERARARLETELVDAIKASNMPKNTTVFQKVAREMESALINGYEMSAAEAVKIVEQDMIEEYLAVLPQLGADRLKKALGKDMLKLIQEEQVRAVKEAAPSFVNRRNTKPVADPEPAEDEKIPSGDFFRNLKRGGR